ncbi:MAG: rhodanese-like domain-containing protein [Acidobacteria bacterium]|nr:rhodanese-like domain-containing protein [Acidobacteriota bacterium]
MTRFRFLAGIVMLVGGVSLAGAQAVRNVPRMSIDELKSLMAKKQVLVIDVRNMQEFAGGHIPGAMNIPYGQSSAQEEELRKEKRTIVLYCACVNESSAARAATEMEGLGIPNLKVLLGGWDEWIKRGEKTEK